MKHKGVFMSLDDTKALGLGSISAQRKKGERVSRSRPRIEVKKVSSGKGISIKSLSLLTGFPEDYIKSELFIGNEEVSLQELRKKMVNYLDGIENPA